MDDWKSYVPVAKRRAQAARAVKKLQKQGKKIEPVEIEGRAISKKFWGKEWCNHLETFADYSNRLPRGRTYARNGSVCHLEIKQGIVEALVYGSEMYRVKLEITALDPNLWESIKKKCQGQIGSLLELLQGKLSDHVMKTVATHTDGLFPTASEMKFTCSCLDWADLCKHTAAALYGIGNRLDSHPNLLFKLRGVDPTELITTEVITSTAATDDLLDDSELENVFGIEMDTSNEVKFKPQPKCVTGKHLKEVRTKMKLSVKDLAKLLKVTSASVYRWEKIEKPLKLHRNSEKAIRRLIDQAGLI